MLVDLAKLSRVVSMSLATGMALATGIGSALAQEEPSVQQIIEALKPKHLTRSLDPGTAPVSAPESNPDLPFIDSLRNRTARSLTPPERERIKGVTEGKPFKDLEINFELRSAKLRPAAIATARTIGEALSSAGLKGDTFLVEGHTDAKGGTNYNQRLSEQRADAVKRFLVEQYKIPARELIAVGYGKSQLKNPDHPFDAENRRVRVVTMTAVWRTSKTGASSKGGSKLPAISLFQEGELPAACFQPNSGIRGVQGNLAVCGQRVSGCGVDLL